MGLRGDYKNNFQNSALKPCKQCMCTLRPIYVFKHYEVLSHYFMNLFLWMLVQWTSKLCRFHISIFFFPPFFFGGGGTDYRYTLTILYLFVNVALTNGWSYLPILFRILTNLTGLAISKKKKKKSTKVLFYSITMCGDKTCLALFSSFLFLRKIFKPTSEYSENSS